MTFLLSLLHLYALCVIVGFIIGAILIAKESHYLRELAFITFGNLGLLYAVIIYKTCMWLMAWKAKRILGYKPKCHADWMKVGIDEHASPYSWKSFIALMKYKGKQEEDREYVHYATYIKKGESSK